MTVKELATLTGVSVRTLHYYDEIGLLKPSRVDANTGYRYYDDDAVLRMQEILFFRELDFPLKTIAQLLASPAYDRREAIAKQRELLILKRKRLDRLINALDEAEKGRIDCMSAFDNHEYETARDTYAAEVKDRFGNTDAYKEHQAKTASYSAEKWQAATDGMNALMAQFAACKKSGHSPDSAEAQALVKAWQAYITDNFYTCTDEILAGLAEMYIADDRFTENIDRHAPGTAAFMHDAIRIYCKKK